MAARAWVVERLGTPEDALRLVEARTRAPGPGEASVAVEAVGLNFPDVLLCAGAYQERPALPFSPGYEAAGTVVEVGPGSAHRPGERVIVVPELPNGALQERLTVPDAQLYPVPESIDAVTAAVLHIAYETAHVALHHRGGLRAVGFASGVIPQVPADHVLLRNYAVVGLHLAAYRRQDPALLRRVHDELLDLLAERRIAPAVDRLLPFEAAPAGLRAVAERAVIGRVALTTARPGSRPAGSSRIVVALEADTGRRGWAG